MSVTLLPASCKKGEWQERVFNNVAVNAGGPQVVSIDYELNFAKASLGMALWVDYMPDSMHLSNTLTVGALWSTQGGTLFFPSVDGPSVILTASGVVKICCPGTPDFKLTLNSTGTGTDHVTAWLCGTCGCCGGGGC
jgi:hypothetical protein